MFLAGQAVFLLLIGRKSGIHVSFRGSLRMVGEKKWQRNASREWPPLKELKDRTVILNQVMNGT